MRQALKKVKLTKGCKVTHPKFGEVVLIRHVKTKPNTPVQYTNGWMVIKSVDLMSKMFFISENEIERLLPREDETA